MNMAVTTKPRILLVEAVVERENMLVALKRVEANGAELRESMR